jgi:hypothetical protein
MRENEFERKVQEQMEDLRIRPSDETWERVEKELREKKKRRAAVLFFIIAGLLLLGYSGYTFLNKSSNQPVAQNEVKKTSIETTQPSINTPTSTINTKNYPAVGEKPETTLNTNQLRLNRQLPISVNPHGPVSTGIVKENTADHRQRKNEPISQNENNPVISNSTETGIAANSHNPTEKNQVEQPADKKQGIISNDIASNTTKEQNPVDSTTAIDSTVAKVEVDKTAASVPVEPKPVFAKNKSKIRFGIEVSGGFVSSQNKVFGFSGGSREKSLDPLQSGYTGTPGGVGTGTNAPRVIIPPSAVKAGKSLRIGLVAEKPISKRSSLSVGLRYSYADESLDVGAIRDTVIRSNSYSFSQNFLAFSGVRNAYSAIASAAPSRTPTKYTNRYHFIELPLLYQTQLNKGKKLGILWNAGIAPGFLIGTNALVYDTTARGVYYRNDNAFKKFHLNMQTGLALQFGSKKKIQWSLGPTVSLDMTRLMKEDVFTEKRYFLYTGLTGRMFLNSRKK